MNEQITNIIEQTTHEKVAQWQTCSRSGEPFPLFERDIELLEQMMPEVGGKKISLPLPLQSFRWRQFNRMLFRNERKLYKRPCSITGDTLVSIFNPSYTGTVCKQDYWWSDEWDPLSYGMTFNFSKGFNEQFKVLYDTVPKMATSIQESENCMFTNSTGDSKNCYMSFRCHYCTNTLYSYRPNRSVDCTDCYQVKNCERLYECIECTDCQNSMYLKNCANCFNSKFLIDCEGCADCFMCCNLANASYCITNKQYTKEEYQKIMKSLQTDSYEHMQGLIEKFEHLQTKTLYASVDQLKCEQSVGSSLVECGDCMMTFMMKGCEGSRWAWDNVNYKTCMDNYSGGDSELCYTTSATKKSYRCNFTLRVKSCTNVMYSMFCFTCNECFGCVGLRNKEFCIFNIQYTREEYNELLPRIIAHMQSTGEWGLFFDPGVSAFPINDTIAYESFPLASVMLPDGSTKELTTGGSGIISLASDELFSSAQLQLPNISFSTTRRTKETEVNIPEHADILRWTELPDSIHDVDDSILEKIIVCSTSGRPYRIVPQELAVYRDIGLPLPRQHPEERHAVRAKDIPPRTLTIRKCDSTGNEMLSIYKQDVSHRVVEKELYGKFIYG